MTKLFILGNGFDAAHCMKTEYNDFRISLLKKYPEIDMYDLTLPDSTYMPNGEIKYDDKQVLSILFFLLNEAEQNESEWNKVEESLGYLNYDSLFDGFEDIYDEDGTVNYWHTSQRNEDIASDLVIPITSIKRFFREWVDSIELTEVKLIKKFNDLVKLNDKFLTFNYTSTLEDVYGISECNVCHIHGNQKKDIFFGHDNSKSQSENYFQTNIGSELGLSEIDNELRKRTDIALNQNKNFFNNLGYADFNAIYSYGFSFNSIDAIYIKEICSKINTLNMPWYLDDYDLKDIDRKKSVIKDCGFKGDFYIYNLRG